MKLSKIAPLLLILSFMVIFLFALDDGITVDKLLDYAPSNYFLAAVFLITMFAVKSLTVFFPIPVLYITSGFLFDPVTSIVVDIIGATITITIPYWIGRYSGAETVERIKSGYNNARLLNILKKDNELYFSFIVRVIGFLPCDIVSLLLGSLKIDYKKYIAGSIPGMLPGLISATFLGDSITRPLSWQFILSLSLAIAISISTTLFYFKVYKKNISG